MATDTTTPPIWEEPVRGTFGDPSSLRLTGVERMRVTVRGESVPPPIYHLTGLIPTEAGYGSSTFAMPVTPWLQTTVPGLITGGILAFLADGPLGTAIMTVLPPLGYTTLAPKPEHYHDIMVIQGTEKHLVRFKKSGPAKVDATAPAEDAQESN